MPRHLLPSLLVAALLAASLAGSAAAAEPRTLVYSWPSNVGPLNPHRYSPNQMFAQAMVYEPLVKYGAGGKLLPWLAEAWETSADGRTWTFHLRQGVAFSDGTPFDARAVKLNHDAVIAHRESHGWLELVKQIQETRVVDPHTVQVVLKDPYYPLLQDLALVRPVRYLSPSGFPEEGDTAKGIKAPIGTGPWMLTETRLGEYDVFDRNPRYWGPAPEIGRIVVKVIPDPNTRAVALETGAIDLVYGTDQISLDTFDRFRKDPRFATLVSPPLATRLLAVNSNRGPTRELAVRRAIQHAVDKAAISGGIFLDTEPPAATLYPANTPYCDLGLAPFPCDPAAAEAALEEAGWRKAAQGIRVKDGAPLVLDLCFVGNDAVQKALAEVLQSDLARVGIRVNLVGEEKDSFYRRQKEGEFHLIFNDTWGPPYDPHSYASSWRVPSHADFQAQSGLPMKTAIDTLIGRVLVTMDEDARRAMYRELLTTIHDQAVYLPISYSTGLAVHRPELTGVAYGATKYEIPFEAMRKP